MSSLHADFEKNRWISDLRSPIPGHRAQPDGVRYRASQWPASAALTPAFAGMTIGLFVGACVFWIVFFRHAHLCAVDELFRRIEHHGVATGQSVKHFTVVTKGAAELERAT